MRVTVTTYCFCIFTAINSGLSSGDIIAKPMAIINLHRHIDTVFTREYLKGGEWRRERQYFEEVLQPVKPKKIELNVRTLDPQELSNNLVFMDPEYPAFERVIEVDEGYEYKFLHIGLNNAGDMEVDLQKLLAKNCAQLWVWQRVWK